MIKSCRCLAWKVGVPLDHLEKMADDAVRHYRPFKARSAGKSRCIDNPDKELKRIQRLIYHRILVPVGLPGHLHGGVIGRSPLTNAQQHIGAKTVAKLDIKGFFPSITDRHVYKVWINHVGCIPPVAALLTSLTTYRRHLPQGSPSSSALANLVLLDADSKIHAAASAAGCEFTRYVDDLVFSGGRPQDLIEVVVGVLRESGFRIARHKVALMPANTVQEVTGYTVNSRSGPSVPRYKRSRARAAVHQFCQEDESERTSSLSSIKGRIQHIAATNPGSASRLSRKIEGVNS